MRLMVRTLFPSLVVALLVCALVVPTAGATPTPSPAESPFPATTRQKLDQALSSAWGESVAPGVVVGVWVGDKGWTTARGTTTVGAKDRPTPADHTRIGSLTKTFVGTLILRLADEGKLELTDTLDKWFPWVPNAGAITIRDLGDMGSGINTYTGNQAWLDSYFEAPRTAWRPIDLIKDGVSLPPKFAPGQGFFYSNTNFLLLGQIAQKVTGESIGRLLRERIFKPLGMSNTSYPYTTAMPKPYLNGYTNQIASGTGSQIFDATHWNPTAFGAAGQIVSTLGDMRAFAEAVGTGSLLSKAGHRAQLQPNPFAVKGGKTYDFGVGTDNGWITHAGTVPGYNTDFGYLPKLHAAIVVLANTDVEAEPGVAPAPSIMSALSAVIAPGNVSTP